MEINDYALMGIAVMTIVTYMTRIGGFLIMDRVTIGPRVERFLDAVSGSVLIAILAPLAVDGDWAARAALATAIVVMAMTKQALLASLVAVAVAAGFRVLQAS